MSVEKREGLAEERRQKYLMKQQLAEKDERVAELEEEIRKRDELLHKAKVLETYKKHNGPTKNSNKFK